MTTKNLWKLFSFMDSSITMIYGFIEFMEIVVIVKKKEKKRGLRGNFKFHINLIISIQKY
jgi:hypothetical protein